MSVLLFGAAATSGKAATTGLFGAGGQFGLAQTAMVAGTGLMAASAIQQGRIAAAQGSLEKKIALQNQQALERQAKAEMEAARLEEKREARKEKMVKAAQRAAIAKSGIGLAGATLSVLADTAFQFSLSRNLILRQGLLRGRELIQRGTITAAQGGFASAIGRQERTASYWGAGASILSGAGGALSLRPSVSALSFGAQSGNRNWRTMGTSARNF